MTFKALHVIKFACSTYDKKSYNLKGQLTQMTTTH